MYEEARKAILESSEESSIYIGADSIRTKKKGVWKARYSVCIIVHRDSCHGAKIFHKTYVLDDYGNLKQRLLNEVMFAIEAATEVIDVVGDRHLAIHLDVNPSPNHKSHIAVKEALGWVRGSLGIDAQIKPNSWAATTAADHMVRNKDKYVS